MSNDDPTTEETSENGIATRREVLQALGAAGLLGPGLADTAAAATTENGWLASYQSSTTYPPDSSPPLEAPDYALSTGHSLEYLGAQWVEFGDPGGAGGAWKHTFALFSLTGMVQKRYSGSIEPSGIFNKASCRVRTDSPALAVAEQRDRDLTGFVSGDGVRAALNTNVKDENENDLQALRTYLDDNASKSVQDLFDAMEQSVQSADDPVEAAQEEDAASDAVINAGAGIVGLLLVSSTGVSLALSAAVVLHELLTNVSYDTERTPYNEGFEMAYDGYTNTAPGGGHFVTFDVFASPGDDTQEPTFTLTSSHDIESLLQQSIPTDESGYLNEFGLYPEVEWTVKVPRMPKPSNLSNDADKHSAYVDKETVPTYYFEDKVNAARKPSPEFSTSPATPAPGESVTFDPSGSVALDGSITEYRWDFGAMGSNQTTSSATPISLAAPSSTGTYAVALTIETDAERTATLEREIAVSEPPVPEIDVSNRTPTVGESVTFDATGSTDPDGDDANLNYAWTSSTSDGGVAPPPDADQTLVGGTDSREFYDSGKTYYVELTVVDENGAVGTGTVEIEPQSASAAWDTTATDDAGATVTSESAFDEWVEADGEVVAERSFGTVSAEKTVKFDYEVTAGGEPANPFVRVYESDTLIYDSRNDSNGGISTTSGGTSVGTFAKTLTFDGDVVVKVGLDPSPSGSTSKTSLAVTDFSLADDATLFSDSFEAYATGSSGWTEHSDNSNGGINVSTTRATDGSQSLESDQPNTGHPSHHHGIASFSSPSTNTVEYRFDVYVGGKQNSGSADTFTMGAIDAADPNGSYNRAWLINMVHDVNSRSIAVNDGGTWVALRDEVYDAWVSVRVVADYSSNSYTVYLDGIDEGTYAMPDGGSASDYTYLHHRNDNYLGWIDDVQVTEGQTSSSTGFSDSFETYSTGSSGWTEHSDNSNGGISVSTTRATDGSQSLESDQPNTGNPSHHHAVTSVGTPSASTVEYRFDVYVGGKQNSGSADTFTMGAIDASNPNDSHNRAWLINMVHDVNSRSIAVNDGGTWVALRDEVYDAWVSVRVVADYSSGTYTVYLDGTDEGTYTMPDGGGSASNYTYLHHRNDNYLGWIDDVRVTEK